MELLFLLGMTLEEAAEELHLSRASVHADWKLAKAWLFNELGGTAPSAPPHEAQS